jgi:hypothetical protein
MVHDVTFVLCIENNLIRPQGLLLCESIREFCGRHRNAPIYAIAPRPGLGVDAETQRALKDLDVEYVEKPLSVLCPEYVTTNRIFSAAWAEQQASTEFLVVLDTDTIFLDEPELSGDVDVFIRPVDTKGSATTGPGDPFEDYWQNLAKVNGIPIEQLPFLTTTICKQRIRASYNGGLTVSRRSKGVMARCADIFTESVKANLKPHREGAVNIFASTGFVGTAGSAYWGSSQTALAFAIWSATSRVAEYDAHYNIPLHLIAEQQTIDPMWCAAPPVHVHYHWMFTEQWANQALPLMARLGVGQSRLDWLKQRLPLAGMPAKLVRKPRQMRWV